jgi:DsbC/DsbD-like thiol-disulfide interchange protein
LISPEQDVSSNPESSVLSECIRQPRRGRKIANVIAASATLCVVLCAIPVVSQTTHTHENGSGRAANSQGQAAIKAGEVRAKILLSTHRPLSGQSVPVAVEFEVAPGWHVYGRPLPEEYTPLTVTFDKELLSSQNLKFPKPAPVRFELLGETLPVYQGRFNVNGNVVLRQNLAPGTHRLSGTVAFQECNDNLCKMPEQARFEIPLWIDSAAVGAP